MPSPATETEDPFDMGDSIRVPVKTYPPCPEGDNEVIVVSARYEMRDAFNPGDPQQPTITLRLETSVAKDDQGKPYGGLWKSMTIGNGKKSNMRAYFEKVLGMPVPLAADSSINFKVLRETIENKDGEKEHVNNVPAFVNLRFVANVTHEKRDDGSIKTKVGAVRATPAMIETNKSIFTASN